MAKKTVLACDNCGNEIQGNEGATLRLTYNDARRGSLIGDYCDQCAGNLAGRSVARRGRPPKPVAAAA